MSIQTEQQLENTRRKLRTLEEHYEQCRSDTSEDAHLRELSMRSLAKLIKQFKEEMIRYQGSSARSRNEAAHTSATVEKSG